MKLDDIDVIEKYLNESSEFFGLLDAEKARLESDLSRKELERDDLLHEIELASLNAIELTRTSMRLKKTLQERRELKDKIDMLLTVKGFTSKFISKGICAEIRIAIDKLNKFKELKRDRKYRARILKDLKCSEKEEK